MKRIIYCILISLSFIFTSCAALKEKKAYEKTMSSRNEYTYKNFLLTYPSSKYAPAVKDSLYEIEAYNAWNYALKQNEVSRYEYFIQKHPDSKYVPDAKDKITALHEKKDYDDFKIKYNVESLQAFLLKYPGSAHKAEVELMLREELDWAGLSNNDSLQEFESFNAKYPQGKYLAPAKARIVEIKTILPEWKKTQKTNTEKAYNDFIAAYPNSTYTAAAKVQSKKFEDAVWNKTVAKNTLKAYREFKLKYPNGFHKEEVEKKIVDLETEEIFSGNYGKMPGATPGIAGAESEDQYATINIKNSTDYRLTIWYSGGSSQKIILLPDDSTSIRVLKGTYKVAAQAAAINVNNYAGVDEYKGGYWYDLEFYSRKSYRVIR